MAEQDRILIIEGKPPIISARRCALWGFGGGLLVAAITTFIVFYFFLPADKKSEMSAISPKSYNVDADYPKISMFWCTN